VAKRTRFTEEQIRVALGLALLAYGLYRVLWPPIRALMRPRWASAAGTGADAEGLDPEAVERVFGLAGPEVLGRELEPRRSSAEQPVEPRTFAHPPRKLSSEA